MPVNQDIQEIVERITATTDRFSAGLSTIEKDTYNKILVELQELATDRDGNIIQSIGNLRIVNKVKMQMNKILTNDVYKKKVFGLQDDFDKITELQTNYFSSVFTDFTKPKLISELTIETANATKETLLDSGLKENVINKAVDIVSENIKSGSSLADMSESLRDFFVSKKGNDGKLVSYSKQIVSDAVSQHAANYNKIVTEDLGLVWFEYSGALIATSRPFCDHMVKKHFIHKSEFSGCISGALLGLSSKEAHQGMIPGTDTDNLQIYRGGYNCQHLLTPVSEKRVPADLVLRFKDKK